MDLETLKYGLKVAVKGILESDGFKMAAKIATVATVAGLAYLLASAVPVLTVPAVIATVVVVLTQAI